MKHSLGHEIQQTKPFGSLEQMAFLNLQRTAALLNRDMAGILKRAGLTPGAFNVLHILKGAGPEGRTCGEIFERLVSPVPDVTRLLDRVTAKGWASRRRATSDRRVVRTLITEAGLRLLEEIDPQVQEAHRRQLSHLTREQLEMLNALLEEARRPFT